MATMPLPTVCPSCGEVFTRDDGRAAACPECQPNRHRPGPDDRLRGSATSRGYGKAWQRLSRRARRLQPYCTDCGSPDDLTADHSPEAWQAHEDGRPIRPEWYSDEFARQCEAAKVPVIRLHDARHTSVSDGVRASSSGETTVGGIVIAGTRFAWTDRGFEVAGQVIAGRNLYWCPTCQPPAAC